MPYKNPEEQRASSKRWYDKKKQNKEWVKKRNLKNREWEEKNKDYVKERAKKYRELHREKLIEQSHQYYLKNKKKINDYRNNLHKKIRIEALEKLAYDKQLKCVRCGCVSINVLQVNHKTIKTKEIVDERLLRGIINGERDVEDFEILCGVCNWLHFFENIGNDRWIIKWSGELEA